MKDLFSFVLLVHTVNQAGAYESYCSDQVQHSLAMEAISLQDKLALFHDQWSPKVIAALNNYQIKLAKIQGLFVRHRHTDTDELFLVLSGEMTLHFDNDCVQLKSGDLYVVPKGVYHQPEAKEECHIMLIEPEGVINTGETGGILTAPLDDWI